MVLETEKVSTYNTNTKLQCYKPVNGQFLQIKTETLGDEMMRYGLTIFSSWATSEAVRNEA